MLLGSGFIANSVLSSRVRQFNFASLYPFSAAGYIVLYLCRSCIMFDQGSFHKVDLNVSSEGVDFTKKGAFEN